MLTVSQFFEKYRRGSPITVGVIGDSTGAGIGSNPGPNLWTNGISYAGTNLPDCGPNFVSGPYYIQPDSIGYVAQSVQDNVAIPSWPRLLRTHLQAINSASNLYNYSASGWMAGTHVANNTVAAIAARNPKPDAVFIAVGINNAKNNISAQADIATLVAQLVAAGILPVLCKQHNIGKDSRTGRWDKPGPPDPSGVPDVPTYWAPMGAAWTAVRNAIETVGAAQMVPVLDFGTDTGELAINLLYDPYHLNPEGNKAVFRGIKNWLQGGKVRVKISGQEKYFYPKDGGALRMLTGKGIVQLELGGSGPVRIMTPFGMRSLI